MLSKQDTVEPSVAAAPGRRPASQRAGGVEHPSMDERAGRGREARTIVARSAHGEWQPAPDRPDPVALLEEQAADRVPELIPMRYSRMLVSPFTFYRGAAYLMASDLATTPRTGLTVQLCGDAHLSNFGTFAAPDRSLIFSLNDFDETLPGPFEWDVKRMVASFAVAGRDRDFDTKQRRAINLAAAQSLSRRHAESGRHEQARCLVRAVGHRRGQEGAQPAAEAGPGEAGSSGPWQRPGPRTA